MKIDFTEDETLILAMYKADSREASLDSMEEVLFVMEEDPEIGKLITETINKVTQLTNEEYLQMDISSYEEELERISADDHDDDEQAEDPDNNEEK